MTITVAVSVVDSLVFASDSASTQQGMTLGGHVDTLNIWNTAHKIFNLRKAWPIGAMTWGQASIGGRSIATLTKELRCRFSGEDPEHLDWTLDPESYTIGQVAERTRAFFHDEQYMGDPQGPFGLAIGGYSARSRAPELYDINMAVDENECHDTPMPVDCSQATIAWRGQIEAINRIIFGVSAELPQALIDLGVPEDQAPIYAQQIRQKMELPLVWPGMPVSEAIELAQFLVDATIRFVRFRPGDPTVGGPIEIAAMTQHEGFKWIKRKLYYEPQLNLEESLP